MRANQASNADFILLCDNFSFLRLSRCSYENFALFCLHLTQLASEMPNRSSGNEILTIKEVADFLKVTERTIYRLAAAKRVPAFKVGGTWRFSRADIDRWISQQATQIHEDKQ